MRDLAFLAFLAAILSLGVKRPFIFVLTYAYIDIVSPQKLSYFLINSIPISLITFGLAFLSWLAIDDKRESRFAPRQALLGLLLIYCWFTTRNADFPIDAALKWGWVWKALVFAIFLPLTLRTKLRIEALALFMTLSAGSIIIVGGIKTLASGGGYGVLNLMLDVNSGLYESSTIACVAIALVPLILYLMKHGTVFTPDWRVTAFGSALIFSCILIPIGTEARTGLICIGVLGILMLRHAKRRFLYVSLIGIAGMIAVPFLPSSFTQRMDTITEYKADSSASTRVAVWMWTLDYVHLHPFGGGFDAFRGNSVRYETVKQENAGASAENKATLVVDQARAYHSAYFEMLGEQGWPGLILWLLVQLGGLYRMEVVRRRYWNRPASDDQWIGHLANALQQGQIVYLVGATFVGMAFQPFVFMLIGMQMGLDTYAGRRTSEAAWQPIIKTRTGFAT
jgi:probable O-glycosylation ligase (exosortase A-associated)